MDTTKPSPWTLFTTFFAISALTIGGGYAMIPVFADHITKKCWMEEKDFYDVFARGQSFPGPMALNTAILVGYQLTGLSGALTAFLGIILPPFFSIILVSLAFSRITEFDAVQGFLSGSYGVVIGLVASMLFKLLKSRKWSLPGLSLAIIGTVALIVFKGFAMPVFFTIIVIAYVGGRRWNF
jgi:chromate transporter